MTWTSRDCAEARARIAAEDADGAYDEEICAKIERLTGRAFGPLPANGVVASVMS